MPRNVITIGDVRWIMFNFEFLFRLFCECYLAAERPAICQLVNHTIVIDPVIWQSGFDLLALCNVTSNRSRSVFCDPTAPHQISCLWLVTMCPLMQFECSLQSLCGTNGWKLHTVTIALAKWNESTCFHKLQLHVSIEMLSSGWVFCDFN